MQTHYCPYTSPPVDTNPTLFFFSREKKFGYFLCSPSYIWEITFVMQNLIYADPMLTANSLARSYKKMCLSSQTMASAWPTFSSVLIVQEWPKHCLLDWCSSIFRYIYPHTPFCRHLHTVVAFSPQNFTPHKNHIIVQCSFMVQTDKGATILHMLPFQWTCHTI